MFEHPASNIKKAYYKLHSKKVVQIHKKKTTFIIEIKWLKNVFVKT
jgi:DNA-binding transcriptional regulator YhcF (GntR family)